MKKLVLVSTALCAVLGNAQAQIYVVAPAYGAPPAYLVVPQPPPPPTRFLFGVGVSGGGDQLASARTPDGSTAHIHAGGLAYLSAGVDYHFTPAISLQGTINYQVDSAGDRHGDVTFERFPIELIGYYQPNPLFRVGGGVRYTTSPKLSGSGDAGGRGDVNFDNTTSAVVEAEYFVDWDLGVKLRYVHETFKAPGYGKVDGSHVGLSFNFYF